MAGPKRTPNPYRIEGGVAILSLTHGQETRIDVADLPRVLTHRWHAVWYPSLRGYYARASDRSGERLHRFILNAPLGVDVDHKNHQTLDNRRENLRLASRSQNGQNRIGAMQHSGTGIRGVGVHRYVSGRLAYRAHVRSNGKIIQRYFPHTPEGLAQAAAAVVQMRRELLTHSDGR